MVNENLCCLKINHLRFLERVLRRDYQRNLSITTIIPHPTVRTLLGYGQPIIDLRHRPIIPN